MYRAHVRDGILSFLYGRECGFLGVLGVWGPYLGSDRIEVEVRGILNVKARYEFKPTSYGHC
jgi:hypothetical protein